MADEIGGVTRTERTQEIRNEERGEELRAGDKKEIQEAADKVDPSKVTGAALSTVNGPLATDGVDKTGVNPAGFLTDPKLSRAELDTRLRGLSTPELTNVVRGLDHKDLDHGKKVTPEGWKALHGEIDRRFSAANDKRDWGNTELAHLSEAVTRQGNFGGERPPWSERTFRDMGSAFINRDTPEGRDALAALDRSQRNISHYVNGAPPASEMTNAQLLREVERIPGMKNFGELASLTGIPGLVVGAMADGRSRELVSELQKRQERGEIAPFTPKTEADTNAGTIAGTAVAAAQLFNLRKSLVSGAKRLLGFGDDAARVADDAARVAGNARQLNGAAWEKFLRDKQGMSDSFRLAGREFDGRIGNRWIEAKSGRYWQDHAQPGPGFEKFKSDMGQRLKIARDNGATMEVHSNSPLPEHVKQWLTGRGIKFFEY